MIGNIIGGTGSVMSVVVYVARLLPVAFGVHTVLDYVMAFLFGILYLKLPVIRAVIVIIAEILFILALEFSCTILIVNSIGKEAFFKNFNDRLGHSILGLPSSILFALVVLLVYFLTAKMIRDKRGSNADSWDNLV